MSRGLGRMEREILENLDAGMQEGLKWNGGSNVYPPEWAYWAMRWMRPGWIQTSGVRIRLPEHIYDLRAISRLLANKRQLSEIAGPFQASFSRAVKSLIRKGLLRVPPFITFEDTTASPRHRDILTQDAYGCREDGEKWLVLEAYCGNSQRMVVRQPATIRFVVSGVRSFIGHPDWWITRFESLEKMGRARLRIIQAKRKKVERAVRRLKMQQIIARSLEKAVAVVTQDLRGHSATAPNQT